MLLVRPHRNWDPQTQKSRMHFRLRELCIRIPFPGTHHAALFPVVPFDTRRWLGFLAYNIMVQYFTLENSS